MFEEFECQYDLRCDRTTFNAEKQKGLNRPFEKRYDDPFINEPEPRRSVDDNQVHQMVTRVKIPVVDIKPKDQPKLEVKSTVEKRSITPKPKEISAPQPLDLFDLPDNNYELPADLFSVPLQIDNTQQYPQMNTVPQTQYAQTSAQNQLLVEETPPVNQSNNPFNLFDLDKLNMGDHYSPAVAKKIEEANKPVSIEGDVPNVPMNQLQTSKPLPQQVNPQMYAQMNTQMYGQMPAMMAYNQFVTGAMNPQWMNPGHK